MKTRLNLLNNRRRESALSLVEMLVASTLLVVILLGLMLMFNQTQRAFRTGMRQNDIMETGRAVMSMITRDIEQMAAAHRWDVTNVQVRLQSGIDPVRFTPPGGVQQTNFLHTFFFHKNHGNWEGVGYRVLNSTISGTSTEERARLSQTGDVLVGALYVFRTNAPDPTPDLLNRFHGPILPMVDDKVMRRLADGVVHLRVTLYDHQGNLFTNTVPDEVYLNDSTQEVSLSGSRLPGSVDIELGILEPQVMDRLRPLIANGNEAAIRNFLINNAGQIHIFRSKIPIRTVAR